MTRPFVFEPKGNYMTITIDPMYLVVIFLLLTSGGGDGGRFAPAPRRLG